MHKQSTCYIPQKKKVRPWVFWETGSKASTGAWFVERNMSNIRWEHANHCKNLTVGIIEPISWNKKKSARALWSDTPVARHPRFRVAEKVGDDRLSREELLFSQMGHRLKQLCTHRHMKQRGGDSSCTTMVDLLLPQHTTAAQACPQPYTQHKADVVACLIDWLHNWRK